MIKFTTESGSKYELDSENNKIRRLSGSTQPTERQGQDGEWKVYTDIGPLVVGNAVLIVWKYEENVAKTTLTSSVVDVEDVKVDVVIND